MQALKEDLQHLQGLPPLFRDAFDTVLCVAEQDDMIGFPVHRAIIAAHSPILHNVLLDLDTSDAQQQALLKQCQIPTMEDDCTAVRAILACMYSHCCATDQAFHTLYAQLQPLLVLVICSR